MSDTKKKIGDLVDAMIAGRSADVDALVAQVVQSKAIAGVGDLAKLPTAPPVTESVAPDFVPLLAQAMGVQAKAIDALVDTGRVTTEILERFQASEFASPEVEFTPGSAFMQFVDSVMPGAANQLVELLDQSAGYQ